MVEAGGLIKNNTNIALSVSFPDIIVIVFPVRYLEIKSSSHNALHRK